MLLYSQQVLFLLVTIFSLSASTLNIPPSSDLSMVSPPLDNKTQLSDDFECDPKGFFVKRPSFAACGGAIHLLPTNPLPGTFRTTSAAGIRPDRRFQLPLSTSNGNCRVTVDFVEGQTSEDASWLQISHVASTLNVACVKRGTFSGGKTTTGSNSRIQIKIAYLKGGGLEETANQTLLEEVADSTQKN